MQMTIPDCGAYPGDTFPQYTDGKPAAGGAMKRISMKRPDVEGFVSYKNDGSGFNPTEPCFVQKVKQGFDVDPSIVPADQVNGFSIQGNCRRCNSNGDCVLRRKTSPQI